MAQARHLGRWSGVGIAVGMIVCAGLAAGEEKPKRSKLTEIRVQAVEAATRVTVVVNGVIDIKHDRLENPARVFVDFADTVPALEEMQGQGPRGAMRTVPAGTAVLKQIRVAENQKGVTRLVFDLEEGEVEYQTQVLRAPNRLLVELRPKKVLNPLAAPATVSRAMPRKFSPEMMGRKPMMAGKFRMAEPPVLMAKLVLPKADAGQMPYRVGGFAWREGTLKPPPTPVARQSAQRQVAAVAASRTSGGKQSLTRVLGLKIGKVVIDPGHGGHDAGSTGVTGLVEKEVTLDIARRLAALVEANLGSDVVLTRNEDVYLSPEQRTEIANAQRADLFISIHANSSPLKTASGVETYYLNFTTSPEALEVAARENASSERSVADLGDLVKKIALKDKVDESREFAGRVQSALFGGSLRAGNRTKDRGVRKAPFIVLIGAGMPSVLTEVGFLSNAREEALLKKPEYRQKIAEALYRGVAQYADTLSHFAVAQRAENE